MYSCPQQATNFKNGALVHAANSTRIYTVGATATFRSDNCFLHPKIRRIKLWARYNMRTKKNPSQIPHHRCSALFIIGKSREADLRCSLDSSGAPRWSHPFDPSAECVFGCVEDGDCLDASMRCERETNCCEYKRCPRWIMHGELFPNERDEEGEEDEDEDGGWGMMQAADPGAPFNAISRSARASCDPV